MHSLIYDLLMTEAWKIKLFPLLKKVLAEGSTIRSYMAVSFLCSRIIALPRNISLQSAWSFYVPPHSRRGLWGLYCRVDRLLLPKVCKHDL